MPSATTFTRPQVSSISSTSRDARQWISKRNQRVAPRRIARTQSSTRAVNKQAEDHLEALRLLIPLAMIMILFVLWYAGMPLLPN